MTLGEQVEAAMVEAAKHKSAAFQRERLYKRKYAEVFLRTEAKNVEERKHAATVNPIVITEEDAWIEAESAHNLAQAKVDGLQTRFEEWRTVEASKRAELAALKG